MSLLVRRWRHAVLLQSVAVAIILLFGVLPGGTWLALPLETRFQANPTLPAHVAGIIALGGTERVGTTATWGQPILSDPMPIVALVVLSHRYPDAKLMFSGGGSHRHATLKEADVVRVYLTDMGFDANRIVYETQLRNTFQNGVFTYQLIRPKPNERWILVTQAISMPRAVAVFRHAGWDVIPFPAGYMTESKNPEFISLNILEGLHLAAVAIHEWVGLIAYRLMGYTDQIFPRGSLGPGTESAILRIGESASTTTTLGRISSATARTHFF